MPEAAILTLPDIGRIVITTHAVERMEERGVTLDDLARAFTDLRKLRAALTLARDQSVRVRLGDVAIVLNAVGAGWPRVLTVYRRGA